MNEKSSLIFFSSRAFVGVCARFVLEYENLSLSIFALVFFSSSNKIVETLKIALGVVWPLEFSPSFRFVFPNKIKNKKKK